MAANLDEKSGSSIYDQAKNISVFCGFLLQLVFIVVSVISFVTPMLSFMYSKFPGTFARFLSSFIALCISYFPENYLVVLFRILDIGLTLRGLVDSNDRFQRLQVYRSVCKILVGLNYANSHVMRTLLNEEIPSRLIRNINLILLETLAEDDDLALRRDLAQLLRTFPNNPPDEHPQQQPPLPQEQQQTQQQPPPQQQPQQRQGQEQQPQEPNQQPQPTQEPQQTQQPQQHDVDALLIQINDAAPARTRNGDFIRRLTNIESALRAMESSVSPQAIMWQQIVPPLVNLLFQFSKNGADVKDRLVQEVLPLLAIVARLCLQATPSSPPSVRMEVVVNVSRMAHYMSHDSSERTAALVNVGWTELLVTCLNWALQNEPTIINNTNANDAVDRASRAIDELLRNTPARETECPTRLISAGVVILLHEAMRRFPDPNGSVVKQCQSVLRRLGSRRG